MTTAAPILRITETHSMADDRQTNSALKLEFDWFLAHHDELVRKYNGKYVVIRGQTVIGVFEDQLAAVTETQRQHPLGTFLVQKVEPGEKAYTQVFHTRVA